MLTNIGNIYLLQSEESSLKLKPAHAKKSKLALLRNFFFWAQAQAQLESWYMYKPKPSLAQKFHYIPSTSQA